MRANFSQGLHRNLRAADPVSGWTEKAIMGRLYMGQVVEIRPAAEILATHDANFMLEQLPFMPEMFKYCGRRMNMHRRANRVCVEGFGLRAMSDTVLLKDARCDGASHDGCQRNCLLLWKAACLKPALDEVVATVSNDSMPNNAPHPALAVRTREGNRYVCQSTRLHAATKPLSKLDLSAYFREIADGERPLGKFLRIVGVALENRVRSLLRMRPKGAVYGQNGRLSKGSKGDLALRAGEWVEVRTGDELNLTVGPSGRNFGLSFEPDMSSFVGRRFQVDYQIEKIISETTAEMVNVTNTVALKDVVCSGLCAKNCPRAQLHFWR